MRYQTSVISRYLRRTLLGWLRLRRSSRPSGLFYPASLGFAGGLVAALAADPETPGLALDSVWLYRAEVGLAFMGAIYIVGIILWLAWHGRGFVELGAFGLTLKASEGKAVEATEADLTGIREQIVSFEKVTISGIAELDARISTLEDRGGLK